MRNLSTKLSGVVLDGKDSLMRIPPRKENDQQANYKDLFDYYRLFADIYFNVDGNIELIGPPLLNLREFVERAEFYIDGRLVGGIIIEELDRMSRITLPCDNQEVSLLRVKIGNQVFVKEIQPSHLDFFKDKNVLVTQQRDNPIEWILYWILYHIEHHGIDSVLIYDNGSMSYTIAELEKSIAKIDHLKKICIVSWDILWGPTGGPNQVWDSDYGQHQAWMHALGRFLKKSNSVIIDDVDELPLHENNISILDMLNIIEEPVLLFKRRNIVDVGIDIKPRLHYHTIMYELDKPLASPKYAFSPKKLNKDTQLLVHRVSGAAAYEAKEVIARHFGSLRMDWRNGKYEIRPLKKETSFKNLCADEKLLSSFEPVTRAYNKFFGDA